MIFPKDELTLFINHLSSNNKNNSKFNFIEKFLEPCLLNSLITYNNNTISSNNIPILNNYSQTELIEILTQDLSSKDKKAFIDYINKRNIKEITTADLSSSNFYVSNNINNFDFKSKSEILSRIIYMENKTKPHNETNQNEVKKLKP